MIGVIKSSFEQHLKFLILSAFGDQLLMMRVLLMTSASSGPLVFRTSFLQNLFSSDASSFLFVDSIALICSSKPILEFKDTKFLSMVLHTWTNIIISNWQFLIPCYHQNSKGNVIHILFQQCYEPQLTLICSLSPLPMVSIWYSSWLFFNHLPKVCDFSLSLYLFSHRCV